MVTITRFLSTISVFVLSLLATSSFAQGAYVEMRQAGINYIIATVGIEELSRTECAYAFKKAKIESFDKKRTYIFSKLTDVDKTEAQRRIAELHPELAAFYREAIAQFKTTYDTKTACGMVTGEAFRKLEEAQERWSNVTGNL